MAELNVTRDVITDLLPVYESGEASGDTRRLVEGYLAADPEFARLVARLKTARLRPANAAPPPEVELRSLERTKRLIKLRSATLAVAIFFSLAPFAFTFDQGRLTWLLIRDAPVVGGAYLFTAAVMWIAYFATRWKLRAG